MAIDDRRKAELMAYCRESWDDLDEGEQALFETIYHRSVYYLTNADITEPDRDKDVGRAAMFESIVNALVLDAWDRRDITLVGSVVSENPQLRRDINQLKFSEPESES